MLSISLGHNELMVKSVEGVYRNGKVELIEPIPEAEGSSVIVTWVQPIRAIDLRDRGIDESQAGDLRRRLGTFTEDWDSPAMNAYDVHRPNQWLIPRIFATIKSAPAALGRPGISA